MNDLINFFGWLLEGHIKNFLYKKNSSIHKAFDSRINNLFRKYEPKFFSIIQEIIIDTIPKELQWNINNFFSEWFYNTIEKSKEIIDEKYELKLLKNNYFLENQDFLRVSEDLENNLKSFKDFYDLQIKRYHESQKVDFDKLINEKNHALIFMKEWIKELEKIYFHEIIKFKNNAISALKFNSALPITEFEMSELNKLYEGIPNIIEEWKNKKYYEKLLKEINNLFTDMINLLK